MKKIVLFLSVLFFFAAAGKAQSDGRQRGPMNPEDMAKRQTERLKETLKLNADQEKKVYDINLKYAQKRGEMFKAGMQGGGDREAIREKMGKMQEEQTKEMKAVLTADQFKSYEKYLEEQRQRRMQGGQGQGPR